MRPASRLHAPIAHLTADVGVPDACHKPGTRERPDQPSQTLDARGSHALHLGRRERIAVGDLARDAEQAALIRRV